ncbi:MAG: hypothetical protein ABSE86_22740 [Bryobacteraceae bacterium]|jgi:hypothetical protein
MLGVIRAVAVLVCLYMVAATVSAQPPVSPRNSYERILVILPIIGSGTAADPMRPSLIPAPGGATPNILNIAISAPVTGGPGVAATPVGGGPTAPQNLILGYTWVPSDDGKFALTEIVMRDRSAFPAIMALPGVTAFVKGVNKLTDIQTAFQQYKKDFDVTKFGVWVR